MEELRALPPFEHDFDTPEGAVLCLEDAYRRKSIESACACKSFMIEGAVELLNVDPKLAADPELRKKKAAFSERAFRKELSEAWPMLDGVESFFVDRQIYTNGIVAVIEIRRAPDGTFTKVNHLVAITNSGWRVLNQISEDELDW